jgi:hypothetical protein
MAFRIRYAPEGTHSIPTASSTLKAVFDSRPEAALGKFLLMPSDLFSSQPFRSRSGTLVRLIAHLQPQGSALWELNKSTTLVFHKHLPCQYSSPWTCPSAFKSWNCACLASAEDGRDRCAGGQDLQRTLFDMRAATVDAGGQGDQILVKLLRART